MQKRKIFMDKISCKILENVPLAPYCTFKAGGVAKFLAEPVSVREVCEIMRAGAEENVPLVFLGGGSNVLMADIDGIVVLSRGFCGANWQNDGNGVIVEVGSGHPSRALVRETLIRGDSGLEFVVGIPGSVGGALAGNAGAQDEAIGNLILWAEVVNADGTLQKLTVGEIASRYRYSSLSGGGRFVTKCALRLKKDSPDAVRERCRHFWSKRASQPFSSASAGCVFKNPPGNFAGKLLDECGCKSLRVGGAKVSERHANFVINYDNASAHDIKNLMDMCRQRVYEKAGIMLEFEVKLFGF